MFINGRPQAIEGRKVLNYVRKDFQLKDFFTADVVLKAGQFNDLGYYTVKTDEARELGFGAGMQDSAIARMYGKFMDTAAAELKGSFKFVVTNTNDNHLKEFDELETYLLNTSATDVSSQAPFPATMTPIVTDRRIHLMFKPDSIGSGTLDYETSIMRIPAGRYNLG